MLSLFDEFMQQNFKPNALKYLIQLHPSLHHYACNKAESNYIYILFLKIFFKCNYVIDSKFKSFFNTYSANKTKKD